MYKPIIESIKKGAFVVCLYEWICEWQFNTKHTKTMKKDFLSFKLHSLFNL